MGQTYPINLQLPDGTAFKGEAPVRGKTSNPPEFALMGWLKPPDRTMEDVLADLLQERDQHEAVAGPWIAKLERALETQRFDHFWVYAPTHLEVGLPKDASREEIAKEYRRKASADELSQLTLFYGLSEDNKGVPGCARIGELRKNLGWPHERILREFEEHLIYCRKWMRGFRQNLPARQKAAARSHRWFTDNHERWLAIEAHRKFINPTPAEALGKLPSFNQGFNGTSFYKSHQDAFRWLGTINLDNPAEADWQITPDKQPLAIPEEPAEILVDAQTEGTGRFLFYLLVDVVDLQDPAGTVSNALKATGLKFSIRRFQQIGP